MKFCAQRGCQVAIKSSDVLCPCCKNPLHDSETTGKPAVSKPAAKTPRAPAKAKRR